MVNLTVGNIRPKETVTVYLEILCGVELRDDGFRFRFPVHPGARLPLPRENRGDGAGRSRDGTSGRTNSAT